MKVVCVDVEYYSDRLTLGKVYESVGDDKSSLPTNNKFPRIIVFCDDGDRWSVYREQFITIEEYRNKQLKELLK